MSLTLLFIIVTVLVSYFAFQNENLMTKLLHLPQREYRNGELYRLLTSGFIHADWAHLLINMFVFYQFGTTVAHNFGDIFGEEIGTVLFAALYLLGIVFANLPTFYKHKNNSYYGGLGASGGVAAVTFSYIAFNPFATLLIYGIIPIPAVIAGVLYLAYSSYAAKKANDNIGHEAHLYGALFGLIFTFLIDPTIFYAFWSQITNTAANRI